MTATTTRGATRSTTRAAEERVPVRLVLVLGALVALGPLTIDLYLPALPSIADDLITTPAAVQLTLTGTLLGLAAGQLVVGPLSDALGRRLPLLAGIAVHVLASLLCVFAPTVGVLGGLRVLQGFGAAAASVTAMAVVGDLYRGRTASRVLSRLMLVLGVAPVLAPTLGGEVLRLTDWRGVFVVLAVAGVALGVLGAVALTETLPAERRRSARVGSTLRAYRTLLRRPRVRRPGAGRGPVHGRAVRLRVRQLVRAAGAVRAGRPAVRARLRRRRGRPHRGHPAQRPAAAPHHPAPGC